MRLSRSNPGEGGWKPKNRDLTGVGLRKQNEEGPKVMGGERGIHPSVVSSPSPNQRRPKVRPAGGQAAP